MANQLYVVVVYKQRKTAVVIATSGRRTLEAQEVPSAERRIQEDVEVERNSVHSGNLSVWCRDPEARQVYPTDPRNNS